MLIDLSDCMTVNNNDNLRHHMIFCILWVCWLVQYFLWTDNNMTRCMNVYCTLFSALLSVMSIQLHKVNMLKCLYAVSQLWIKYIDHLGNSQQIKKIFDAAVVCLPRENYTSKHAATQNAGLPASATHAASKNKINMEWVIARKSIRVC